MISIVMMFGDGFHNNCSQAWSTYFWWHHLATPTAVSGASIDNMVGQGHCGTSTFPMAILGSATTTSRRSNWQTIWCRSLFTAVPSPEIMGVISSWSTQSSWVSLLDKYRPAFGIFLRRQSCCVKRVFGLLPFFSASFLRLLPNPRVL